MTFEQWYQENIQEEIKQDIISWRNHQMQIPGRWEVLRTLSGFALRVEIFDSWRGVNYKMYRRRMFLAFLEGQFDVKNRTFYGNGAPNYFLNVRKKFRAENAFARDESIPKDIRDKAVEQILRFSPDAKDADKLFRQWLNRIVAEEISKQISRAKH